MTDQARRATDSASHPSFSISQLIATEQDEQQRTILLVIHEMSQAHQANTKEMRKSNENVSALSESVKSLTAQFEAHAKAQDDLISQGKVWKQVVVWAFGVVQTVILSGVLYQYNDSRDLHGEQLSMQMRIQKIEQADRMDAVEGRRTPNKGN